MERSDFLPNQCQIEVVNTKQSAYGVETYNKLDFINNELNETFNPQDT